MITTNTMPTHHTSSSPLDGKVTPARSEKDRSVPPTQTLKDTPPEDAFVIVSPSFHLNPPVSPEQYAHTDTVAQDSLSKGTLTHPSPRSHQPIDLTTQAQALMQSMIKATEKAGQENQLVVPTRQGMEQTNTSNPIKTSAADLNVLLNQAPQGLSLTTHSPGQVPLIQAQALPSTTHQPTAQTQGPEWAAVRVDSSSGKWGEQMIQVLQDRVTFQAQQNLQEAKIRLDPPDLGKLDLLVRVEGDRLSVQINANTAVTREALMQVSDRLRAELQEQNFVHVDVNVGSDQGQERQGYSDENQQEDPTIFSARESNAFQANTTTNESEHWLNTQA